MPRIQGADESQRPEGQPRGLTRAHGILAGFTHALVRAVDADQLQRDLCRILVDLGGYRMAWIGELEYGGEQAIRPVASAGDHDGYLSSVRVSWGNNEFARGPAGAAARTRTRQTVRDIRTNPAFRIWRSEALARGYLSIGFLPLICEEEVLGVLGIYAAEAEAFDGDELALLDELAVVLSSLSQADDAGVVAQKVVAALARPFEIDGHSTYVTASVGIALYPGDGAEPDELIGNADTAMYRAKQRGRNGYQFYVPQMKDDRRHAKEKA